MGWSVSWFHTFWELVWFAVHEFFMSLLRVVSGRQSVIVAVYYFTNGRFGLVAMYVWYWLDFAVAVFFFLFGFLLSSFVGKIGDGCGDGEECFDSTHFESWSDLLYCCFEIPGWFRDRVGCAFREGLDGWDGLMMICGGLGKSRLESQSTTIFRIFRFLEWPTYYTGLFGVCGGEVDGGCRSILFWLSRHAFEKLVFNWFIYKRCLTWDQFYFSAQMT